MGSERQLTSRNSPKRFPEQRLYPGRSQAIGTWWHFRKDDRLQLRARFVEIVNEAKKNRCGAKGYRTDRHEGSSGCALNHPGSYTNAVSAVIGNGASLTIGLRGTRRTAPLTQNVRPTDEIGKK